MSAVDSPMLFSSKIKIGILFPVHVSSILCHLVLIYHLIFNRQLRQALHNHVILIFLITNFLLITVDMSMIYYFLFLDYLNENYEYFCVMWNFIDTFLSNTCTFLMMWSTFERHLLIFHDRQLYDKQFKRILFHYVPIFLLILYAFLFFGVLAFLHPGCSNENYFHYDELFCGRLCYVHANIDLSTYDIVVHRIVCSIVIFLCCIFLLIRVLHQKRERNQIIRWRRHFKMTIQIISISILYLIGIFPAAIGELIHIFESKDGRGEESAVQEEIFLYLFYIISILIPFVCLMSLPEIYSKIPFFLCKKRSIVPTNQITHTSRPNVVPLAETHTPGKTQRST